MRSQGRGGERRGRRPEAAPAETARLRVEHAVPGGAFLARLEGGEPAFLSGAAPGERVSASLERRGGALRGRVLEVLEPGEGRVAPACPHASTCGGCDWMHLSPEVQAGEHARLVREALARALPARALPEVRVHAASSPLGYRTRARLRASARAGGVRLGYRSAGSRELAEIGGCVVLSPPLEAALPLVRGILEGSRGEGDVSLALGAGGGLVLEILWDGELSAGVFGKLESLAEAGRIAGARARLEGASRAASFGDPRVVMRGADGLPLVIAAGRFAQAAEPVAAALAKRVGELVLEASPGAASGAPRPPAVVELFAGSGTLSVAIAGVAASLVAVERDADAAEQARENLRTRGLSARFVAADAEGFALPAKVDVVVLDPPRGGSLRAARAIAASAAKGVVYVSCDPTTLARDARVLAEAGFSLASLDTFELFPQTSHVETLARFARERRPAPRRP